MGALGGKADCHQGQSGKGHGEQISRQLRSGHQQNLPGDKTSDNGSQGARAVAARPPDARSQGNEKGGQEDGPRVHDKVVYRGFLQCEDEGRKSEDHNGSAG